MADRPEIFAPNGVLGDGRFNGTMQNVVGPTLVAMATRFRRGDPVAYRLVFSDSQKKL